LAEIARNANLFFFFCKIIECQANRISGNVEK